MDAEKLWTTEEMEQLSPDARQRLFNDCVVTDVASLPPDFLERVRAKERALLQERGVLGPNLHI